MVDDRGADHRNEIDGGSQQGPVLQGRDFFGVNIQTMTSAPVALTQLPPRISGFTARDTELAIMSNLLDSARTPRESVVSAVVGLAGIGKTALAIQAGHAARESGKFKGGVLFIDLHGYDEKPIESTQALEAMLRALGIIPEHIPLSVESRCALYRSELAKIKDPVLVIIDNASSESQIRPLLPSSGPHRVVVTSRQTLGSLDARLVDLTVLDDAESVILLDNALKVARPTDNRISDSLQAAIELARNCGGLPLALQIVAAMLKSDPARSIESLAHDLLAANARLVHLKYDDGGGTHVPSVTAAFELSYRRLSEDVAAVFRFIALNPGPDFSTAAAAALANLPVSESHSVLVILAQANLVERTPGIVDRWQMHDLVRLYAGELGGACTDVKEQEEARDRLLAYYVDISSDALRRVRALDRKVESSVFTGSGEALTWLEVERPNLAAAARVAAATGRESIALRLRGALMTFKRPSVDNLLATLMLSLSTARELKDRQGEGISLGNIGLLLQDAQRFEDAMNALQGAAAIFRETGNRYGEAAALTNLGLVLRELRKLEEAIKVHQVAISIFQEIGKKREAGMALNSLGTTQCEAELIEAATAAFRDSAKIFEDTDDPYRGGVALDNLGLALQRLGRREEATFAYRKAIALFSRAGDRIEEVRTLTNLQEIQ